MAGSGRERALLYLLFLQFFQEIDPQKDRTRRLTTLAYGKLDMAGPARETEVQTLRSEVASLSGKLCVMINLSTLQNLHRAGGPKLEYPDPARPHSPQSRLQLRFSHLLKFLPFLRHSRPSVPGKPSVRFSRQ
ncbi:hypothetical protein EYF80_008921 [Liparis tanakae]|uniref:Uncharacterized protein n=1 Tax=Liparis tanakae TaxID=230148 RepID=A0A4Z2IST8_9TELE|nr:hypothetical protein EYF80_008921 [Liparis tanakae]